MAESDPDASRGASVAGWLMFVCGGIVTLTCGGCTLVFFVAVFSEALRGDVAILALPLILGGVPTLAGVITMVVGWNLLRRQRSRD